MSEMNDNNRKISLGWDARKIVGMVFSMIGGGFTMTVICLLPVMLSSNDPADRIVAIVFGIIGGVFLILGLSLLFAELHKKLILQEAVNNHVFVNAEVTRVYENGAVEVDGEHPYIAECEYADPETDHIYHFRSKNLFFDAHPLLGTMIRVYVQIDNMKNYYVDVENAFSEDLQEPDLNKEQQALSETKMH